MVEAISSALAMRFIGVMSIQVWNMGVAALVRVIAVST